MPGPGVGNRPGWSPVAGTPGGYAPDVGAGRTAAAGGLRLQSNKSADRRPAARSPARPAGDAAMKALWGAEGSCSRSVGTGLRRRSRSRRRCRTRSGRRTSRRSSIRGCSCCCPRRGRARRGPRGPCVGFHHGGPVDRVSRGGQGLDGFRSLQKGRSPDRTMFDGRTAPAPGRCTASRRWVSASSGRRYGLPPRAVACSCSRGSPRRGAISASRAIRLSAQYI